MGIGGSQYIITRERGNDPIQSGSNTNRDFCTAIETICADGSVMPPFLILRAKVHLEKWYTHTNIPGDYTVAVSDSGYNNDELSIEYIKTFNNFTSRRQIGVWRLLIFDGFGSYSTKEVIDYCDAHNIAHTTHNLQPLDVGVFQAYKEYYRNVVERATRERCLDFNKLEFLYEIKDVRRDTMKPSTIRKAFELTGIYPFDLERVLYKVLPPLVRPATLPQRERTKTPTTPASLIRFCRQTEYIINESTTPSESLMNRVLSLMNGLILVGHNLSLATRELMKVTAAARERA